MMYDDKYLYKCIDCGKDFFTEGEKKFYESKQLKIPTRCKECRDIRKKIHNNSHFSETYNFALNSEKEKLYDEIMEHWSVEAKKENMAYFYNIKEVETITNGKASFVIGRKGSGKTAIAQYLKNNTDTNIFSEKLSFKNFPFNILYSLENQQSYTAPNQYISIWKYLIYSYICVKMIQNESIDLDIRNKLEKLYTISRSDSIDKLIKKWTSKSFGIEILGVGFTHERECQPSEITWIDTISILENVILEYCDTSKYIIVFDELDEDYKDFEDKKEQNRYMCMLTSLFKAVQDIRGTFDATNKNIYPVVFLRSDIFSKIKDSDKNKWSESIIDMDWSRDKLQKMLAHRISIALGKPEMDFDTAWHELFSRNHVYMGNKKGKHMDIYTYMERSTEMRPRDFIQYIKDCVTLAKEKKEQIISPTTVKEADNQFSEYLKQETIDEVFAAIPNINEILGLLSTIRKQSFNFATFETEYNKLTENGEIVRQDVKFILLTLFDAGVIGNQPSMKGQAIFRFSKKSPRFNFNETMLIHRGLFKALQIF